MTVDNASAILIDDVMAREIFDGMKSDGLDVRLADSEEVLEGSVIVRVQIYDIHWHFCLFE